MLIQINTDNNLTGREEMVAYYSTLLEESLDRFREQITRLEVHLGDENSKKQTGDDKRCMIEARIKGLQPVAVTHYAGSVDLAVSGAIEKMKRSLDSTLGKLRPH